MAIIKLCGVLVGILCKISPKYKTYVTRDNRGVKHLLACFQSALYGKMLTNLLYYCNFTKSLTDIGFDINPYDPPVANKVIYGSHMTICFHVYD